MYKYTMNGFGIQKNNIEEIIKSIEKQISNIQQDFNNNVNILNNRLNKSSFELKQLKEYIYSIPNYTEEFNNCKAQIDVLNTTIEDIKNHLNTIEYCEVED